jgi:myo-inositol-1(or 4)-monophosphatase
LEFYEACVLSSKEFLERLKTYSLTELTEKFGVGEGGDKSMKADLLSEEIFARNLSSFGRIYSEESGYIGSGEKTIYLDPLDGSDNFAAGLPYYGVSVCLSEGEKPQKSFVCNFANGDYFYKENALEQGNIYEQPILTVDRPFSSLAIFEKAYANPKVADALHKNGIKFRSPGALALSLSYSRCASFALFMGKLRIFDIIAALYFLDDMYIYNKDDTLLVSHDKKIFEETLEIVLRAKEEQDVL